jgi:curved DNA-binding protein CbpA
VTVTYYELLGVGDEATTEEIESAYRAASKAYHPDIGGPISNPALFREVTRARAVLLDAYERGLYDQQLLMRQHSEPSANQSGPSRQPPTTKEGQGQSTANETAHAPKSAMHRSVPLLVIAATTYFTSRWVIRFGDQVHAPQIAFCGHQLMALSAIPTTAFLIVPREQVKESWVHFRGMMAKCPKVKSTKLGS